MGSRSLSLRTLFSLFFFFSSRRRHTRWPRDWSSDVCSSDLVQGQPGEVSVGLGRGGGGLHGADDLLEGGHRVAVQRSEERRVGKSVDLGGGRTVRKKRGGTQGRGRTGRRI